MPDDQTTDQHSLEASVEQDVTPPFEGGASDRAEWRSWSNLWQVPTIVLCSLLILSGVLMTVQKKPKNDFTAALDRVDQLIATNQLPAAMSMLRDVIEPTLGEASKHHLARFHAAVADWVYFAQKEQRQEDIANYQRIDGQYAKAIDFGLIMAPARIERWAETLLKLGKIEETRDRLAQLDALDLVSGTDETRERRNRVFRMLIEYSLITPGVSEDEMLQMITKYQTDPRLSIVDHAWAVVQKAALRLEAGDTRKAIDHLLVDIRRLEQAAGNDGKVNYGSLYTLLGRGYYDLGEYDTSKYQLRQALSWLDEHHPARGDVLTLLGKIAFVETNYEDAYEHFDRVVREFISTRSYLPGLLGRAEVRSVLGDHKGSQADYQELRKQLSLTQPRRDVNKARIAESLRDRHDAALASRQLPLALEYAEIAEQFFDAFEVPSSILLRVASTSRALSDLTISASFSEDRRDENGDLIIDLNLSREANDHFRRSGDYYIRHARSVAMLPDADNEWSESLWLGADAYDLGGWQDLAIQHFNEYIGARSTSDPRRAEVIFRLAQAHHAQLEYEAASQHYETVIANHPRSRFASASFVPLARCYFVLKRFSEAEQQLLQVISGQRFLDPNAMEFRDALLEISNLYHDTGRFTEAIKHLNEMIQRYPNDDKRKTVRYLIADSYRGRAIQISKKLEEEARIPPSERNRMEERRRSHFQMAITHYTALCDAFEQIDQKRQNRLERDMLRRAYLYRGDCAFQIGDFELAIQLYDYSARKYRVHHSSMYALVQIVNSYNELGMKERAQTAHRRALVRLEQLPDEIFSAPDSLMDREAWERWLENSPVAPKKTVSALPVGS